MFLVIPLHIIMMIMNLNDNNTHLYLKRVTQSNGKDLPGGPLARGLATYGSSVSFGHPEHCYLTVWTPKSLGQDLLMMTIIRNSACSVTPTIQTKQLLA